MTKRPPVPPWRQRQDRLRRSKIYPAGRICEAKGCTARLSIYNADHLCARCEETDRLETHEAERLQNLALEARIKKRATRLYVGDGAFVTERS